jgi:hypothetical protein
MVFSSEAAVYHAAARQAGREAFFHVRYFIAMMAKYRKELESAPESYLPSGWAALLCLFKMR